MGGYPAKACSPPPPQPLPVRTQRGYRSLQGSPEESPTPLPHALKLSGCPLSIYLHELETWGSILTIPSLLSHGNSWPSLALFISQMRPGPIPLPPSLSKLPPSPGWTPAGTPGAPLILFCLPPSQVTGDVWSLEGRPGDMASSIQFLPGSWAGDPVLQAILHNGQHDCSERKIGSVTPLFKTIKGLPDGSSDQDTPSTSPSLKRPTQPIHLSWLLPCPQLRVHPSRAQASSQEAIFSSFFTLPCF